MTLAYYLTLTETQLVALLPQYASAAQDRILNGFSPSQSFGGATVQRQREDIRWNRKQLDLIMSALNAKDPINYPNDPLNRTTVIQAVNDSFFELPPPTP